MNRYSVFYTVYDGIVRQGKSLRIFIISCFSALLLIVLGDCGFSTPEHREEYVTVGVLLPLTGEFGIDGIRSLNGLLMLKNEINSDGGILGKMLDIIALDDENNEARAVEQYGVLKSMEVSAIVGSIFSRVSIAIAEAAEGDGIPIISPFSSNPILTEGRKNVFRAIFTDEYQANVTARFARENLGAKTALLINGNSSYAHIIDAFSAAFTSLGGTIAGLEIYDAETHDFSQILKKYVSNPPDIIFSPIDYAYAAELSDAAGAADLKETFLIGTDAWSGLAGLMRNGGIGAPVIYYPSPFSPEVNDPEIIAFTQKVYDLFSFPPDYNIVLAYAAMQILSSAIQTAESTDADKIVRAIKENEVRTIIGNITFNENNNPNSDIYMTQVKNGKLSIVGRFKQEPGR